MAKTLTVAGNIQDTSTGTSDESTGNFDLYFAGISTQSLSEAITFSAVLNNPFIVPGPFPASIVALRVIGGGPVTLLLTGPGGTDQAVTCSESFMAVAEAAPFTGVKLVGNASVELMLSSSAATSSGGGTTGGNGKVLVDGADVTADFLAAKLIAGAGITFVVQNVGGTEQLRIDATSVSASAVVTIGDFGERYVLGASENLLAETSVDFNLLSVLSNITCALNALTQQTGGASGTYFVRVGGTAGAADGTIVATLSTTHASYPSTPDHVAGSPFARPSGRQLVKLTGNASVGGQKAFAHAAQIVFSA